MRNHEKSTEERLRLAATAYREREFGRSSAPNPPDGYLDEDGAWWPSESERRPCCDDVIQPNAANKFSLKYHCATQKHLASLFDVDQLELQRELRRKRKAWRSEAEQRLDLLQRGRPAQAEARRRLHELILLVPQLRDQDSNVVATPQTILDLLVEGALLLERIGHSQHAHDVLAGAFRYAARHGISGLRT